MSEPKSFIATLWTERRALEALSPNPVRLRRLSQLYGLIASYLEKDPGEDPDHVSDLLTVAPLADVMPVTEVIETEEAEGIDLNAAPIAIVEKPLAPLVREAPAEFVRPLKQALKKKPVEIRLENGKWRRFESITEAAEFVHITPAGVDYRLKNRDDYRYG